VITDSGGASSGASMGTAAGSTVLIGPPGAGCSAVGRTLAASWGVPMLDLAEVVAQELGTRPELALVAIPEARYRVVESTAALRLLAEAEHYRRVVALGSGCVTDERVRQELRAAEGRGDRVVALTATVRCLASRNGLNAPRSMALGNVHHEFVQMLHAREATCRELASMRVDTTDISPRQAAAAITASSPGR
jgi:shikimate kinase